MARQRQGVGAAARLKKMANVGGSRKAAGAEQMGGAIAFTMVALLLTKLVGFVRDILINSRLGYGPVTDGFYVGLNIPDLCYELLVGGALAAAVTPSLAAAIERNREERIWPALNTFFSLLLLLTALLVGLGEGLTEGLVAWMNPDKTAEVLGIAVQVSRVMLIQTIFFLGISVIGAVLNANKIFGLMNYGNLIYSLIGVLFLFIWGENSLRGAHMAALGLLVGALVFFFFLFHFARPYMGQMRFCLDLKNPLFHYLLWLVLPALLSRTFAQVNVLVQNYFTNQFTGAVTSLRQARTIFTVPYGVVSIGIGTVILPNLSGFFARRAEAEARVFLSRTMRLALFLVFPIMAILIAFSFESIQTVFQWSGAYTDEQVGQTALSLVIYSVAIPICSLSYFFQQAFFAMRKSWIALVTSLCSLIINAIFCYIFVRLFGWGLWSIPFATLLYYCSELLLCLYLTRRLRPALMPRRMLGFLGRGLLIAFNAAGISYYVCRLLPSAGGKLGQLLEYGIKAGLVFLLYFLFAALLKMPEIQKAKAFIGRFTGR